MGKKKPCSTAHPIPLLICSRILGTPVATNQVIIGQTLVLLHAESRSLDLLTRWSRLSDFEWRACSWRICDGQHHIRPDTTYPNKTGGSSNDLVLGFGE